MTLVDVITLVIAGAGLALGVLAAVRDYQRDRVKLKVTPQIGYPVGPMPDPRPRLGIEVVNLSTFPVTVAEVGFGWSQGDNRHALAQPITMDGEPFSRQLAPHDSVTGYFAPGQETEPDWPKIRWAYAITAAGEWHTGKSPVIKTLKRTNGNIPPPFRKLGRGGTPGMLTTEDPGQRT